MRSPVDLVNPVAYFTLTKDERLQRGDFRDRRWLKCSETNHFSLLIYKNDLGRKRIAVTVRKKVANAVVRNRVRRLIKEFFRLQKDLFIEGYDNLIKVKQLPPELGLAAIREEVQSLLEKRKMRVSINQ